MIRDENEYINGLSEFVEASPTSYHAAHKVARQLIASGFTLLDEIDAWDAGSSKRGAVVIRDGAVLAWKAASDVSTTPQLRVFGSHTDSPTMKLKPEPAFVGSGWNQVGVEVYGGPLLNSWLDRDLEIAGRLVTKNGEEILARTGAVARIPQLAIHLDRQVNSEGLKLDRQRHTQPVLGVNLSEADADPIALLAQSVGVSVSDVVGVDALLADTQAPARIGVNGAFLASGRLDNLSSVYAGLIALLQTIPAPGTISIFAAFDHEEIGSESRSGASGPFLEEVIGRIFESLGAGTEDKARAIAGSWCISSDAGHSVHPNYREQHDPNVQPLAGNGPILKINAVQRYATDAHGAALWAHCSERAGVQTQTFVSNNRVPCGSTIGPLTAARLGIRTVDIGVPLLSMHSARELAHTSDLYALAKIGETFFEDALTRQAL